ncbi:CBM_collapsed_G0003440.mRNA.1.CDS.1 [Saccharomyces cerevisiae]|nr:CBM_collapsed_G0003440.mRNA.1.CDS.1 [Saccharomyces cerevisiae]
MRDSLCGGKCHIDLPICWKDYGLLQGLSGKDYTAETDPGVLSVKKIYSTKRHGYATEVMAASFRNLDELKALAGIDNMTLPLNLLEQLYESTDPIENKLNSERC